jgi:hypothetical protein
LAQETPLEEGRPFVFEAQIDNARDSQVAPCVSRALSALEARWSEMVMDHVSRLRDGLR